MAEFVVNNINNKFDWGNNVSEALQTLVKVDTYVCKPALKVSSDIDLKTNEIEDNQFVMKYKAERYGAMRRKQMYKDNT